MNRYNARKIFSHKSIDEGEKIFLSRQVSMDTLIEMRFKKRTGWVATESGYSRKIKDDEITIGRVKSKFVVKINGVFVQETPRSYKSISQLKLEANDIWKQCYKKYLETISHDARK